MTVTSTVTQSNGPTRIAHGRYFDDAAIAADVDFDIGFMPRFVRIMNETGLAVLEWSEGMTDGLGLKTITAGTMSEVAAGDGITPVGALVTDSILGFTLGQDADILVTNEQLSWWAHD